MVAALIKREPALIVGLAVSAVILVAGQLGFVLDEASVTEVVAPIVTALIARTFVTPADAPGV